MEDQVPLGESKAGWEHLDPPVVDYSTNLSKRRNWSLGFVVAAALAAIPLRVSLNFLSDDAATVLSVVVGPGAVYTLLRLAFDHYVWRLKILRVRFSNIPDLRGRWEGCITVTPSAPSEGSSPCFVVISQTWTRIALHFDTLDTHSVLTMATVNNVNSTGAPGFRYEYLVTPKLETDLAKKRLAQWNRLPVLGPG